MTIAALLSLLAPRLVQFDLPTFLVSDLAAQGPCGWVLLRGYARAVTTVSAVEQQ